MKTARKIVEEEADRIDSPIYIPTGTTEFRIPTGSIAIDRILGGGFPSGLISQVYGYERVGKTTLIYHTIAEAQKMGLEVAFLSLEGCYREDYAQACGIDTASNNFALFGADFAESAFNTVIEILRQTNTKLIVIDSITAAVARINLEKKQSTKDAEKGPQIGAHAKVIGDFVQKLVGILNRNNAVVIFTNQYRAEIKSWGGRDVPSGGKALQYFTSIKLKMHKKPIGLGGTPVSKRTATTEVTIEKSKELIAPVYGTCEVDITHGIGIDRDKELFTMGKALGIIEKKGAWFSFDTFKWHGGDDVIADIRSNDMLHSSLETKIMADKNITFEVCKEEEELDDDSY